MISNVILFCWKRPTPGREQISSQHFQEFSKYLGGLQQAEGIQGFDVVLLNAHGGDLNGFFFIRGESEKLDALVTSEEWQLHVTRAELHLDGLGVIHGAVGELVMERMGRWARLLPE